ncbi:MAG: hypothetical protein VXZ25_04735, partial [Pseudomonadota bacterium]|nr:hypothetical protein [Pseudomonadota bacterium]
MENHPKAGAARAGEGPEVGRQFHFTIPSIAVARAPGRPAHPPRVKRGQFFWTKYKDLHIKNLSNRPRRYMRPTNLFNREKWSYSVDARRGI